MAFLKEYYTVKLHDTDAAGILFFANQFRFVHDIYESFLGRIGFDFGTRFAKRDFFIPIVHAEADYLSPLRVGDTVEMALEVDKIGRSSFALKYTITDLDGIIVGSARTVHVTINPETGQKMELPGNFRRKLEESVAISDGN